MPWLDWQFWVVSAAAVWGAWTLLRQLLPKSDPGGPACGTCATGAAACAKPRPTVDAGGPPLVVLESRRPQAESRSA